MVKELLKKLEELLSEEKKLLLKGIKGKEEAEKLEEIEKEKLEVLSSISQLEPKEFKEHLETVKRVERLNKEVEALLLNNLLFVESILKEIFPERDTTYTIGNTSTSSLLNKKV
ncbi:hypothetical protein [Phorcysia thermohydrogeniphila]|uniref:FlgN protein n=1 Tax=Phorcysia thermohydrogeniphila TaxID=936138 RepID=A0A4R1GBM3_9BACT|nr:hypothetical protein [Phorcysia thermohydrogeniphila]TCK05178.1 hypothetical protein CLV27_0599 [Phorcysia thermohydrogeniphila]